MTVADLLEKPTDERREESLKSTSTAAADDNAPRAVHLDAAEERRIVLKLDLCIVPIMAMFYLLSFLDRANIGNARVAGLQKGLGLTDHQYQICVTILYVPYILAELPANLLLRRIGPRLMMPTILTIWGMICALQGTVTSFAGLVTIRAFLGLVEGPMFPGIVLYLSGFYTRKELSLRIALFFSTASLSGAFSGLLAAAIENMDGLRGKPGWAWIFILEGVFSTLVGLVAFFIVPSTPSELPRWFTNDERDFITKRLIADRPTAAPIGSNAIASADAHRLDAFSFLEVFRSLSSPHVLINFVALFMNGTMLYGLALFLPSIVNSLGFSSTARVQLVSVGPFAAGFFYMLFIAYYSDKYHLRAITTCISSTIAMIGFIMFLRAPNNHVAYGSLFLSVSGVYALPPLLSAWMANNSEPHYRRATSVALGFVATNAGGILSTWRYPTSESPHYTSATIMNIVFAILVVIFCGLNVLYLTWAQRKKELRRAEILAPYLTHDGVPEDGGPRAWAELGDRHPDFRYVL